MGRGRENNERTSQNREKLSEGRALKFSNVICIIKNHYSSLSQKFLTVKRVIGVGKEEKEKEGQTLSILP